MRRWGTMDPWYSNRHGDHDHHNRSYKIQVTKTGRINTCNRQHMKPTPITAENFLRYQANRHTKNRPTRCHHWSYWRHSPTPTDKTITYDRSNHNNMPYEHKDTNSMQDIKGKQRKNVLTQYWTMNTKMMGKILRTRYGRIVKKSDSCISNNT